jgi:hypothetical protein
MQNKSNTVPPVEQLLPEEKEISTVSRNQAEKIKGDNNQNITINYYFASGAPGSIEDLRDLLREVKAALGKEEGNG